MRDYIMRARLYLSDMFSGPIRGAARATSGFRNSVRSAQEAARGLTGGLGTLRTAMIAFAGAAAIKGAFNWLVGANADMETYQNTLAVVLKSQEKAVETLAWANKFAAQTPFEIPQVIEATTRMTAYGLNAQKTLGIIGDMASVMGKDLMQAVEAVADAQTGELERMKEFGITKKMIEEQAKLMGANPINSKGQISDMTAFNAALFALMEKRYAGGMEMQSKTFNGMLSNASDFIGTLGRDLGKPLFEKMKAGLGGLLEWADRLQESGAIDEWVQKTQRYMSQAWNIFMRTASLIGSAIRSIRAALRPVTEYVKDNWGTIGPYVKGVAIAFLAFAGAMSAVRTATFAASIVMRLLSAAMLTSPIGWIIIAIGLLVGWFIRMNGGIDGAKKKLLEYWAIAKEVWGRIWTAAKPTLMALWQNVVQVSQKIAQIVQQYWPQVRDTILGVLRVIVPLYVKYWKFMWGIVWDAVRAVYGFIVKYWPLIRDTVVNAVIGIYNTVAPAVMAVVNAVVGAFMAVYTWVATYWPMIRQVIMAVWLVLGPYVMAAVNVIKAVIVGAFMFVWGVIKFVWSSIVAVIKIAWAVITGVIKAAWAIISGIFGFWLSVLTGDWGQAWQAIVDMVAGIWGAIESTIGGIFDGLGTFFKGLGTLFFDSGKAIITTMVDGIKSMAKAPVEAVKNVLGKVRDFLPFSDAKKGPLSELTYSGGAIMTTLSTGVMHQKGSLQNAVRDSLATVSLEAPATQRRDIDTGGTDVTPVRSSTTNATNSRTINIEKLVDRLEISGADGRNVKEMAEEFIAIIYEKLKGADETVSAADMGALLA